MNQVPEFSHRILIASANALFREGIHNVYAEQWNEQKVDVVMARTMAETLDTLENQRPDLVIVDHDDKTINRFIGVSPDGLLHSRCNFHHYRFNLGNFLLSSTPVSCGSSILHIYNSSKDIR